VLSGEEIVALCRQYTLYEWTAQSAVDPIPVDHAKGVYFYTPDGKRYIDFNSQLMSVNAGHGDRRIIDAIKRQVEKLAYVNPFMATEPRALLGKKLAELMPGDMNKVFFTLGGAEANENAVKLARAVTGRHKIIARYRSYHGATGTAMAMTGDPRRWPNDQGTAGVVHVLDPYHGPQRAVDSAETSLRYLQETIELEGPATIAAFFLETVTGTNGVLIPPDGYLQGVRELCDRYGILMVCDEIMSGFGRTGEWFAVNHWNVVPDIMTMAKGLTSSYVPLGAVGMRPNVAQHFEDKVFFGGLTYNSHPLACAAGVASIKATILIAARDGRATEATLDAARRFLSLHKLQAASDLLLDFIAAGYTDREAQRLLIEVDCGLGRRDVARDKCRLLSTAYRLDGRTDTADDVERLAAII